MFSTIFVKKSLQKPSIIFAEATFSPGSDRTVLIAGVISSKDSVTKGTVFVVFFALFELFLSFLFLPSFLFIVGAGVSVRNRVVDPCALFMLPEAIHPVVVGISTSVALIIVTFR